jgi:predicted ester cyclase
MRELVQVNGYNTKEIIPRIKVLKQYFQSIQKGGYHTFPNLYYNIKKLLSGGRNIIKKLTSSRLNRIKLCQHLDS